MRHLSALFITIVLAASGVAQAEKKFGLVKGRVTDERQGIIPDTRIIFTNLRQEKFEILSDQSGSFQIYLLPGRYTVRAEYNHYDAWDTFVLKDFKVLADKHNELNIVLRVDSEWSRKYGSPVIGESISGTKLGEKVDSSIFSTLRGTIYDQVHAVVPEVEIVAKRSDGRIFKATSDLKGHYEINLPSGEFTIEFNRSDFRNLIVKHFMNVPPTSRSIDVDFLIGKCADCGGAIYGEGASEQDKPIIIDFSKQKDKSKIKSKEE